MKQYRKKPIVVDAVQVRVRNLSDLFTLSDNSQGKIRVFMVTTPDGAVTNQIHHVEIDTLEGTMTADEGDWIIVGVKAEVYPCKNDIFHMTYEEVRDAEAAPDHDELGYRIGG